MQIRFHYGNSIPLCKFDSIMNAFGGPDKQEKSKQKAEYRFFITEMHA